MVMEEFVIRQNILHFRHLLSTTQDEEQRQKILQLLAEEEVKLARPLNSAARG
jgi:hypothetical protein